MRVLDTVSRRLNVCLLLAFCILLLCFGQARAEEARLTDIVVTNDEDYLLLYFSVTDCFTEEMKKAIDNGINTTFTFFVRLEAVRNLWWDRDIADLKVSHDIKYDSLKKVYTVNFSPKEERDGISVKDFEEAKRAMSEIIGLKVTELKNLKRGDRYQISMMAELDKIRLPFYFHYIFFFLSLWDFETDWYTVDFRY